MVLESHLMVLALLNISLPYRSYLIWCESCQLGKHSRTSFPRSVTRDASSPFAWFTLTFAILAALNLL